MKLALRENIHRLEIERSQIEDDKHRMCCSVFAPHINLAYNTGIARSMEEIDKVVDIAVKWWTLNLEKGGKYEDNNELVGNMNMNTSVSFSKNETKFMELLEKWYAIQVYFYANKEFVKNIKDDWIIQIEDWEKYKGRYYAHTFNVAKKWNKYYVFDSVYTHINHKDIEVDDITWFRNFIGNTCFAFI